MVWNTDDTDDLHQEVQLRVWRHLSAFRSESTFRTWIIRVAINEVLQSYRREKRRGVCQPLRPIHTLIRECHPRVAPIEICGAIVQPQSRPGCSGERRPLQAIATIAQPTMKPNLSCRLVPG